jgi:MYXO-CTERM domain-containing protein
MKRFSRLALSVVALGLAVGAQADPVYPQYYIGVDSRPTVTYRQLPTDAAVTLDNPNRNRLTLLVAHWDEASPASNHYHSIGTYSYTGPTAAPSVRDTSGNNRIPEVSTALPPLSLLPGSGLFAGKLISGLDTGHEYEGLLLQPTKVLDVAGAPDNDPRKIMFHSSGDRWSSSLGNAQIALELVSITPGLHIADMVANPILQNVGDIFNLGVGDDWSFTPTFWTDAAAAPGTYSAEFRLHDGRATGDAFGSSGRFHFDFRVNAVAIPEPSTITLLAPAVLGALALRRRRRLSGGR